jgi:peptide/nickel transport system ATP-binding protein
MLQMQTTKELSTPEQAIEPLLQVNHLKKYFPIRRGFLRKVVGYVKAVDDVNFYVNEGETLGLVGESGCGKTTSGRCILRAINPTSGEILYQDPTLGKVDLAQVDDNQLKQIRASIRMIFQDPYASLNPRMTLLEIVGAPLRAMGLYKGKELEDRVAEMLTVVGLRPEYMRRYPHASAQGSASGSV